MNADKNDVNFVECRICHNSTTNDLILSPCLCKGSLAYVHSLCLEQWLNSTSRDSCELCDYQFNAVLHRKYTFFQSVWLWIRQPANRRLLLYDITIGLVLTFLIFISMAGVGLHQLFQNVNNTNVDTAWSEGLAHLFLIVVLAGYLGTMYAIAIDHLIPWYTWWVSCKTVRLIYDKSKYVPPPLETNQTIRADACQPIQDTDTREVITMKKTMDHHSKIGQTNIDEVNIVI